MLERSYNQLLRTGMRWGYRVMTVYWRLRRPQTAGVGVALWHAGELLLVRNSYRRMYTLPGGGLKPGEGRREAASRELREEVGVLCPATELQPDLEIQSGHEHKRDRARVYEIELDRRPTLTVDNREVVWAGFVAPERLAELSLCPITRTYLRGRGDR
jgi:8-oxo-dGTP diphosphatase